MFGELLVAVLPADLEVTFGEVSCPARLVAVTIANTGPTDERYALRVAGRVQRTELVPAGTTVISRVRLPEDRPTTLAIHTAGESVASARRTADCVEKVSAAPESKGGTPTPAEPSAIAAPFREGGAPKGAGSPESTPSLPSWRNVPGLAPPPPKGTPQRVEGVSADTPSAALLEEAPSAPENGVPRRAENTPSGAPTTASPGEARVTEPSAAEETAATAAVERKAKQTKQTKQMKKAKRKREAAVREARRRAWRRAQPKTLPMTGISPAFGYTGLATAVTGGVLAWYALLWPRRRTAAFASRERSR